MSGFKHILKSLFLLMLLLTGFKDSYCQKKDSLHISLLADAYFSWCPASSKAQRIGYIANYHHFNKTAINFSAADFHYRSGQ
jgi:hypothetical protein